MVGVIDVVGVSGGSGDDGEVEGLRGAEEGGGARGGGVGATFLVHSNIYISVYNTNR